MGPLTALILSPMKKQLVLFILLLCCSSCASQKKEIIAKSTIKLEGRNTNIRDLIKIDGYYYMKEYPDSNCRMFFEDGTWVDFYFKRDTSDDDIKANMSKSVTSWMDGRQLRWGSYWGVYKIENDTLIVYRYDKGTFWKGWSFTEEKYKVIDKETVQRISYRSLLKAGESSNDVYGTRVNDTFHFAPADSLPSSDCWLKEEKWIWRNEEDWKEYQKQVKK
jgi:hypothetical protein